MANMLQRNKQVDPCWCHHCGYCASTHGAKHGKKTARQIEKRFWTTDQRVNAA
jgi:hypothetical protein